MVKRWIFPFEIILLFFLFKERNTSGAQNFTLTIAILANPEPINSDDAQISRVNALYVRWIEQSLGKVVLIHPWYSIDEINDILSKVNGVIFLGGDRDLRLDGQYEKTAALIFKKLMYMHRFENNSIPLWATCQGFQLLHILLAGDVKVLDKFNSRGIQSPIELTNDSGRLFGELDFQEFDGKNITAQFHYFGVGYKEYEKYPILMNFFTITSTAKDLDGKVYINSVEAKNYPIYAVQFHPEMVPYFLKLDESAIPRNFYAVKFSQYLSNFFLKQASSNFNMMTGTDFLKYNLINSFSMTAKIEGGSAYYFFNK